MVVRRVLMVVVCRSDDQSDERGWRVVAFSESVERGLRDTIDFGVEANKF